MENRIIKTTGTGRTPTPWATAAIILIGAITMGAGATRRALNG